MDSDSESEKDPFAVLGVSPLAGLDEIKQAYREKARQEHPDLYPPARRHRQQLRMMEVNKAYMQLIALEREVVGAGDKRTEATGVSPDFVEPARRTAAPFPGIDAERPRGRKDPAYEWHRQGFNYLARTRVLMNPRRNLEDDEQREMNFRSALEALRLAELAYRCFLNVITGYPDSIWSEDALEQLEGIERSNKVYQRMIENSLKDNDQEKAED